MPWLLPSPLGCCDCVAHHGHQHLHQTSCMLCVGVLAWTSGHPVKRKHQVLALDTLFHLCPVYHQDRTLLPWKPPGWVLPDIRDLVDPRRPEALQVPPQWGRGVPQSESALTLLPVFFSKPCLCHQSGSIPPSGPARGQTHILLCAHEASSFPRPNRSKQVLQR